MPIVNRRGAKGRTAKPATTPAPAKTGQHKRIDQRLPLAEETTTVVNAKTDKASSATPSPNVVRNVATAPHRVNPHAPAPESAKVAKAEAAARGKEAAARESAARLAKYVSGERVATAKAELVQFSNPQLVELAKGRGYVGYSGLTKDELCQFIIDGGQKRDENGNLIVPKAKGPKAEDLRAECKAAGYVGYSSQNKAGLQFMLDTKGDKPMLKDGTYSVGTVSWMQQVCRELGIAKFSGKKKGELVRLILNSGKRDAVAMLVNAYGEGKMEADKATATLIERKAAELNAKAA